ncbi:MAG: DUF4416 family protein [Clostridia bacterium]|nr:DUF4416 family protein [Clostridia bacterium]
MGACEKFEEEKLIIGVIYHEKSTLDTALRILTEKFGEIEDECEEFSFSKEFSDYYDGELGGEGMRKIYSFSKTVDPETLSDIKLFTNELEIKLSPEGMRIINLDPGLISHGRVMLATTKKTGFRVPLKDGIYTELTLFYARGAWQKFPWTYRDYQSERVQSFLTRVRKSYLNQRKEKLK